MNLSSCNLLTDEVYVSNASELYLEKIRFLNDEMSKIAESFSRIIVVNSECCASETSVDDTSEIILYNGGKDVQRIR